MNTESSLPLVRGIEAFQTQPVLSDGILGIIRGIEFPRAGIGPCRIDDLLSFSHAKPPCWRGIKLAEANCIAFDEYSLRSFSHEEIQLMVGLADFRMERTMENLDRLPHLNLLRTIQSVDHLQEAPVDLQIPH